MSSPDVSSQPSPPGHLASLWPRCAFCHHVISPSSEICALTTRPGQRGLHDFCTSTGCVPEDDVMESEA